MSARSSIHLQQQLPPIARCSLGRKSTLSTAITAPAAASQCRQGDTATFLGLAKAAAAKSGRQQGGNPRIATAHAVAITHQQGVQLTSISVVILCFLSCTSS